MKRLKPELTPLERIVRMEAVEALYSIVDELPERLRMVIVMRSGLDDGTPRTLKYVGLKLGVSVERVRQIESRAFRFLLKPQRAKRLLAAMEVISS